MQLKNSQSAIEVKQLSLFQTFFRKVMKDNTTTIENLNISVSNRSNLAANESSSITALNDEKHKVEVENTKKQRLII